MIQAVLSAPPTNVTYRDWIIYRSSLSLAEVSHLLNSSSILHASLEVYAPLDKRNLVGNRAQSMSVLQLTQAAGDPTSAPSLAPSLTPTPSLAPSSSTPSFAPSPSTERNDTSSIAGTSEVDVSKNDYYVGLFIVLFAVVILVAAFFAFRHSRTIGQNKVCLFFFSSPLSLFSLPLLSSPFSILSCFRS